MYAGEKIDFNRDKQFRKAIYKTTTNMVGCLGSVFASESS